MAGDPHARAALDRFAPLSYAALQVMIMAMDDYVKNIGKKSFFGRDKGQDAQVKYLEYFMRLMLAMNKDGHTTPDSEPQQVLEKMTALVKLFRQAFPNWPDAYQFFDFKTSPSGDLQDTLNLIRLVNQDIKRRAINVIGAENDSPKIDSRIKKTFDARKPS